jgi:hypothetical protein
MKRILVAVAGTLLLSACLVGSATATELTPDAPGDPNGPPPPPPPMPPADGPGGVNAPPPGSTAAMLDASAKEDTGVGLHLLYLQPEVGFGWSTLGNTVNDSTYRSGAGPMLGVGAGLEFITFQLGGRLRSLMTPNYNLWSAGGEIAYQPGSGRFWPRIGLAVGYAWGSNFPADVCGGSCGVHDIKGLDIGLRGGLQYFVTSKIEIGADLGLDALMLKRRAITGYTGPGDLQNEASGTGFMAVALVHLGLHYP